MRDSLWSRQLLDLDVIATEIMADLEVALEQFRQIAEQLGVEE